MKARTAMGIAMILGSFAFYAGGGVIISSTLDMKARQERQKAETDRQCVELVNTLPNVNVAQVDGDLTAVIRDVVDPRKALSDATVAAMMCPGKKLAEVCLGDKCQGANDSVALRFKLVEVK